MSVRWQTFSFKKLLTKYPIIPTACHPLHSHPPLNGGSLQASPPWNTARPEQVDSVFYVRKRRLESVVKRQPVIWIWFRVSYTKSRGLLSRIIIKIIQRISPVSKITGYLFTYGLFAAFSS